jgi:hypothetical protein
MSHGKKYQITSLRSVAPSKRYMSSRPQRSLSLSQNDNVVKILVQTGLKDVTG